MTTAMTRTEAAQSVADIRTRAFAANAQGRADEAREILEAAIAKASKPDPEIVSDLAAMALGRGELVPAIAFARHALRLDPVHDSATFTLALALAGVGSNVEALTMLSALTEGDRGERFKAQCPDLAALAHAQREQIARAGDGPAPTATPLLPVAPKVETSSSAAPSGGAAFGPGDCRGDGPLGTADGNGKYNFSHLVQSPSQTVGGPIQDDEALALYALVRTMRLRRVLEIGGLSGYSARNFLAALSWDRDTAVYTVDVVPVASLAPNHYTLQKDVADLEPSDVHGQPLDLVFFDAHVLDAQLNMYVRLVNQGLITDDTVIALHDTGLHPRKSASWSYPVVDANGRSGFVHQAVERQMVNLLRSQFGYDAISLHADVRRSDERLPFRHGLTLMKKHFELRT